MGTDNWEEAVGEIQNEFFIPTTNRTGDYPPTGELVKKIKIYLDNCCFNRPFDDQTNINIRLESQAKLYLQEQIQNCNILLVWSFILQMENQQNPFEERRNAIQRWEKIASEYIPPSQDLYKIATNLERAGVKAKDALHVSAAIIANADYFLTTDYKLLNKLAENLEIKALNPLQAIGELNYE